MNALSVQEVYDKYKHLDHLLSDKQWLSESPQSQCLHDLWMTIKQESAVKTKYFGGVIWGSIEPETLTDGCDSYDMATEELMQKIKNSSLHYDDVEDLPVIVAVYNDYIEMSAVDSQTVDKYLYPVSGELS